MVVFGSEVGSPALLSGGRKARVGCSGVIGADDARGIDLCDELSPWMRAVECRVCLPTDF